MCGRLGPVSRQSSAVSRLRVGRQELKSLQDQTSAGFTFGQDLIRHNLVVFRSGEGALSVLPDLVDVIPEARLNLVIYYLKQASGGAPACCRAAGMPYQLSGPCRSCVLILPCV